MRVCVSSIGRIHPTCPARWAPRVCEAPTLGTMILGLIAGTWLKQMNAGWPVVGRFVLIGLPLLAAGYALDYLGVCPVVKRIWTPSWVLFSGGWCFLLLALFTAVSMTIVTTGFGATLSVPAVARPVAGAAPVLGVASLAFGLWYAAAAWSLAPYPF